MKVRQLVDSYTGEDISSTIRQSAIKDIRTGTQNFFRKREAATGEYHMDKLAENGSYTIRRCCVTYGEVKLLDVHDLETGYLLLDWFVAHDRKMKLAAKHFQTNPFLLLDLIDQAVEEIS